MSGDKPRKVYKKIYRKKGEKMNGEPIKQLNTRDKLTQQFLLKYGRICNALKMEGLPKPELEKFKDGDKDRFKYKLKSGKGQWRVIASPGVSAKTTNYFYY